MKKKAMFAAGCFWGVEASFSRLKGVISTQVGYTGGHKADPNYGEVCSGTTGHAEAVLIEYDPDFVAYRDLLGHLFRIHDPTSLNMQGPDIGEQYRSAIFHFDEEQKNEAARLIAELDSTGIYQNPIVTQVVKAGPFYRAEEYHQKYFEKNGTIGCHY